MPPQLRMFMRMMLQPARQSLLALPTTYCEFEEPSRPCTMMTVGRAGANLFRLPVAVAENLAGDLACRARARLRRAASSGGGQMVVRAEGSCRRWSADDRWRASGADENSSAVLRRSAHPVRRPASVLSSAPAARVREERCRVERAGRFVLVLEVDVDVALAARVRRSARRRRQARLRCSRRCGAGG